MKKWCKVLIFICPLFLMVAAVNWYVDSYAYLRITYDEIGTHMIDGGENVVGLEESGFDDRSLLLACLKQQKEAKKVMVIGSSRVLNFDHTMFGTDSFYNAGLSESTIDDLIAVTGILAQDGKLPETMIIGVDSFLFNTAHNNDRWMALEPYENYMQTILDGKENENMLIPEKNTGRDNGKWLSLDYFRYNVTCIPGQKRFAVSYTGDWETEQYTKHCDGSIAYQKELRDGSVEGVITLTEQAMEENVVYRMTDYEEIDTESMWRLSALIDYLKSQNVEVILYLPPYSPMMYDYIEAEEAFRITLEIEEEMLQMASRKQIALYGSYNPEKSGLTMTDLYDVYHVKTEKMPDTYFAVIVPEDEL
ncbi:MAG: hypothetical protein K2N85_07150 [Lachnospiraceae bacterium]|nr:hypothetical protein [Lachnospiraceae bacterium]